MKYFLLGITLLLISPFIHPAEAGEAENEIRAVMAAQARAWNRGDIPGFMAGYWKSDDLRFASGGTVTYGWQGTLENYQQGYASPEAMGRLSFSNLSIKVLSETYAVAFGRWDLARDILDVGGLFTLVFEKRPEGWRIIADHTSSDDLPVAVVSE